jgi:DNA-binding PadR family transcriptional regulator
MTERPTISTLEYHVLLSMAGGPQYGYAIKELVEVESRGTLSPPAGSLYRVIARLITRGWLVETDPADVAPHPGLTRRYYDLTADGRAVLADEARRLREVSDLARRRLGGAEGRA